jgi:hypothetical protein
MGGNDSPLMTPGPDIEDLVTSLRQLGLWQVCLNARIMLRGKWQKCGLQLYSTEPPAVYALQSLSRRWCHD